MSLTVELEQGRAACRDSVDSFLRAARGIDEYQLLGASRCHGWARLDVLVHVIGGWQEMLAGLVSLVDREPTVDTASYWSAFRAEYGAEDPVEVLTAQRRRSAGFARPSAAVGQLANVGASVLRGIECAPDRHCQWDGQVFAMGDFLALWAVENAVHQLDLDVEAPVDPAALRLVRATVEEITGRPMPDGWSDERVALVGSGRDPVPDGLTGLPAFG
jgi:hypothetical protein